MNVKEQMFEIDVTDVEDNAESSWMLRKERSLREVQAQQGRRTAGPITGCSDQRLLKNIISRNPCMGILRPRIGSNMLIVNLVFIIRHLQQRQPLVLERLFP